MSSSRLFGDSIRARRRLRAVSSHLTAERTSNDAGPLAGVKVVEWTTAVQGPAAGQYLRDMGASVIKIEGPVGDGNRHGRGTQNNLVSASTVDLALRASRARVGLTCGVRLCRPSRQPRVGLEPQFVSVNMGKRSLSIDMKDPASMAVVLRLLEDADVFVSDPMRLCRPRRVAGPQR